MKCNTRLNRVKLKFTNRVNKKNQKNYKSKTWEHLDSG